MFNIRTSLLALVAVASIGTALVTSTTSADARPGMGGFRGGFHGAGIGRVGGFRQVGGLHRFPRFHHRPHWHQHRHYVRWHRPWIYGVGTAALAAPAYAAVAARPAAPCTCLSKEYTQDNVVVFKDRCTNEVASAPMGGQQQSQSQPGDAEPVPQK